MYCGNCGTQVQEGQNYCNVCGKPITGATPPASPPAAGVPPVGSVASHLSKHIRALGILWLVLSALRLVPSAGMLFFTPWTPFFPFHSGGFLAPVFAAFRIVFLATAVAGLIAGWGLLERAPWARTLALVVGVLSLVHIPFGTALGIYTLWVLGPSESAREFNRTARVV
jgi:hypothetical protein